MPWPHSLHLLSSLPLLSRAGALSGLLARARSPIVALLFLSIAWIFSSSSPPAPSCSHLAFPLLHTQVSAFFQRLLGAGCFLFFFQRLLGVGCFLFFSKDSLVLAASCLFSKGSWLLAASCLFSKGSLVLAASSLFPKGPWKRCLLPLFFPKGPWKRWLFPLFFPKAPWKRWLCPLVFPAKTPCPSLLVALFPRASFPLFSFFFPLFLLGSHWPFFPGETRRWYLFL